jgi:carboxypeptidase family protein
MVQVALFIALLFLSPTPSAAQGGQDTGALKGMVQDPAGALVQGAKVKLVQVANHRRVEATSDEKGRFEFTGQPMGDYILSVTVQGFKVAEVRVTISASPAWVRVRLVVEEVNEEVTVRAQTYSSVSTQANADMIKLDEHLAENLPAMNGDPLTVASLFVDPTVAGTGGPEILVDGVPTDVVDLPISSIRDVEVNKNPYSPEFGRPGKGRIEVKTKHRFHHNYHGTVFTHFQNSALDARNAFAAVRPLHQQDVSEAELNGPISRRITFLLAGRYDLNNQTSVIDAQTPFGPVTENFGTPERNEYLFTRLNYSVNANHKLSVSFKYKNKSFRGQGVGGFNLPERATDNFDHANELMVYETSTPTAFLLNEFRVAVRRRTQDTDSTTGQPAIIVLDAFSSGGAQVALQHRNTFMDIENITTWARGRHTLRFGGGARPRFWQVVNASNFGGTFTFSSLSAFSQNTPFLFTENVGNPKISDSQHEFYTFLQDEMQLRRNLTLMLGLRYEGQSNGNSFKNLAPRLAVAYAPGAGSTILRAGFGVFYERQPEIMEQQSLLYNGTRIEQIVISDPSFPNPIPPGTAASPVPSSIVRIAPDLRFPYLIQGNFAAERKLGKGENYLTVDFTTVRGVRLYRMRNINAPLPGTTTRPNPNLGNVDEFESTGTSRGNSLTVTLRTRPRKNMSFLTQYVLSRAMDDTGGLFSLPANNYDLRPEWGRADYDRRHRFNFLGTYNLPRGFRLGGIMKIASGVPYNITTGFDSNLDTVANDRPPGVTRNTGQGPGYADVDTRFSKTFPLKGNNHGEPQFEIGVDAFNLFNHVNFKNFVGTQTSPFFGRANSAEASRQLQLSLRFSF